MTEPTWYTFLVTGSGPCPARGPHRSEDAAMRALRRFRKRYGADAGTHIAAGNICLAGPFPSRKAALEADISTHGGRPL